LPLPYYQAVVPADATNDWAETCAAKLPAAANATCGETFEWFTLPVNGVSNCAMLEYGFYCSFYYKCRVQEPVAA
jgi:hypothetical protein